MPSVAGNAADLSPVQAFYSGDLSALRRIAPLAILLGSICILAPEINFALGDLAFPPYRFLTIVLLFAVAPRLFNGMVKYRWIDLMVGVSVLWIIISFVAIYGFGEGMVRSVAVAIDTGGAYLIARACIYTYNDLRRLLVILALPMAFAGIVLATESLSLQIIYRPFFASIFGPLNTYSEGRSSGELVLLYEYRMGLLRGFGPFSHPILSGAILTATLPLFLLGAIKSWPKFLGILAAFLGYFSLSSAVILALMVGVGTVAINYVLRFFNGINWWRATSLIALAATLVHFASKGGIINIISRMTLTPGTAFYRQLIWEYGWKSMLNFPLYGIGYNQYARPTWMTASIDAHFLALGVRNGFIAPLFMLMALICTMIWLGRRVAVCPPGERNLLIGMNCSLAILLISSMTVTFFSEANLWFMAILAIGVSLAMAKSEMSIIPEAEAEAETDRLQDGPPILQAT